MELDKRAAELHALGQRGAAPARSAAAAASPDSQQRSRSDCTGLRVAGPGISPCLAPAGEVAGKTEAGRACPSLTHVELLEPAQGSYTESTATRRS